MVGKSSEINARDIEVESPMESQNVNIDVLVNVVFYLTCPFETDSDKLQFSYSLSPKVIFDKLEAVREDAVIIQRDCFVDCSDLYFDESDQCIDYIGLHKKMWEACADLQNFFDGLYFDSAASIKVHIYVASFKGLEEMALTFCDISDLSEYHEIVDDYFESVVSNCVVNDSFPFTTYIRERNWGISVEYLLIFDYALVIAVPKDLININNQSCRSELIKKQTIDKTKHKEVKQANNQAFSPALNGNTVSKNDNSDDDETILFKLSITKNDFFPTLRNLFKYLPPFGLQYQLTKTLVRFTGFDNVFHNYHDALKCMINGDWDGAQQNWKEGHFAGIAATHKTLTIVGVAAIGVAGIACLCGAPIVVGVALTVGTIASFIDILVYPIEGISYKLLGEKMREDYGTDLLWSTLGVLPVGKICKFGPATSKTLRSISTNSTKLNILRSELKNAEAGVMSLRGEMDELNKTYQKTKGKDQVQVGKLLKIKNIERLGAVKRCEDLKQFLSKLQQEEAYIHSLAKEGFKHADSLKGVNKIANNYYSIIKQAQTISINELASAVLLGKVSQEIIKETFRDLIFDGLRKGSISVDTLETIGSIVYALFLQGVNKNSLLRKIQWKEIISGISNYNVKR